MATLQFVISGVMVGMTVAAPIGPMGALCIQRTLADGFSAGIATGLGAATIHLVYSAMIFGGFDVIARPWLEANVRVFGVASAGLLFWLALRTFRRPIRLARRAEAGAAGFPRFYMTAIGLGAVNPLTILLLFAAFHAISGPATRPELVVGVFVGSMAWWVVLSGAISNVRGYLGDRTLSLTNKMAGFAMIGMAVWTLLRSGIRVLL